MIYDFSKPTCRRGTNSYKWDSAAGDDIIPLWVADMDFETYPGITEALRRRVDHAIFGYTRVPDSYYDAVCRWFEERHGWRFHRDDIIYTSGVVPAISAIIKALTLTGDQVVVMGPVYNCFSPLYAITAASCQVVHSSIIKRSCVTKSTFMTSNSASRTSVPVCCCSAIRTIREDECGAVTSWSVWLCSARSMAYEWFRTRFIAN